MWLVANLYIIVTLFGSSNYDRRLWECVVTHICSMDTPYVAYVIICYSVYVK
jgi:hypothetical protein